MTLSRVRPLATIGLLVMVAAISTAWWYEIVRGYVPCELCLTARIPYYVGIPLALLGLLVVGKAEGLGRTLIISAAFAMVATAAVGVYHAGAEWAFWPGPASCGGGNGVTDASSLLATLEQTQVVSCTEAAWRFLGISFAGWNVVASVFAAIVLFAAAFSPRRPA